MWLCLNDGFLSIVTDPANPGNLLVRARNRKHLKAFLGSYGKIVCTPNRDYRYRASLPAEGIASLIANRVSNISYDNFKDSVRERKLHTMYELWWGDHHHYQRELHQ